MINQVSFGKRCEAVIQRRQVAKNGLQLAEQVLRDTQNYYGRPNSSSYLRTKVYNHKDNPKYQNISERIRAKAEEHDYIIDYTDVKKVDTCLTTTEKTGKMYGNCDHCAKAVQHEFLFKHNVPSVNVIMEVKRGKDFFCNHAFNVSNIQKGMDITKPHTWGKETVITDLWSGIALKSDDAINHFYRLFNVNPFEDTVIFKTLPAPEGSLQRQILKMNDIQYQGYQTC